VGKGQLEERLGPPEDLPDPVARQLAPEGQVAGQLPAHHRRIAPVTSLRLAPALLVLTSLAIAGLATRWWPGEDEARGRQEAREPGAGSRKMRLRAMSSTGAGSPLRMASRRESWPDR
jgi:hypothetical protein